MKQTADTLKSKVAEMDGQYGISEKASATSRSIGEQWNQIDEQYGVSRSANTASSSINETMSEWGSSVAEGLSNTFQTPAVQDTLATVSTWTNNLGRSIGALLQPATDSVTKEYHDIKEQSAREINAKQMERAKAKEGIPMEELGDLNMNEDLPIGPEGKMQKIPSPEVPEEEVQKNPDVEKIPPPEEPNEV